MFIRRFFVCLACCFSVSLILCSASPSSELAKKRALADLDNIHHIFEVGYAPADWKKELLNWELQQAILEAKERIQTSPTLKECQIAIRDFFNSAKDYHVKVKFFSTESASLPFLIKGVEGRYFVSYVDHFLIPVTLFPFEEGDEILFFGGEPIHDAVVALREREYGHNTLATDQALAEMALTYRKGAFGQVVPQGTVEIIGLKKGTNSPIEATLTWQYVPEKIKDIAKLGAHVSCALEEEGPIDIKNSSLFKKMMMFPMWDKSYVGSFNCAHKHDLGARSSFLPQLGFLLWRAPSDAFFDAYIFLSPTKKKIGYVRIPHYNSGEEEVTEFGELMNFFQMKTDALVIDQLNNPGGDLLYAYALASTLTDKPLFAPKHRIALTQNEVFEAHQMLPQLELIGDDFSARLLLGDTMGGYPVDLQFVQLTKDFFHFIIDQWNRGNLFTEPTHLFGFQDIQPHPNYRYTKPILLLVNELDFSCGDMFPIVMQDSQRATLMGVGTAGAGGYISWHSYPNQTGIKSFSMTGSQAERQNHQPIENLGVTPDITYKLSVNDLQNGYKEYRRAIVENLRWIQ